MDSDWDVTFDQGETPESIDAGGRTPQGWYQATLVSTEDNQKNGMKELTFKISRGAYVGMKVTKTLFNPRFSDTPEKSKNAMQHAKAVGKRLGLIADDAVNAGRQASIKWSAACGKEYVIHVKHRAWEANGKSGVNVEVDYMGVYPLDHPLIPSDVRTALELGPHRPLKPGEKAAGASTATAGGTSTGVGNGAGSGGAGAAPQPPANMEDVAAKLFN